MLVEVQEHRAHHEEQHQLAEVHAAVLQVGPSGELRREMGLQRVAHAGVLLVAVHSLEEPLVVLWVAPHLPLEAHLEEDL